MRYLDYWINEDRTLVLSTNELNKVVLRNYDNDFYVYKVSDKDLKNLIGSVNLLLCE